MGIVSDFVVAQTRDGMVSEVPCRPRLPVRRRRGQWPDKPYEKSSNFGQCQRNQGVEAVFFWGTDIETRRTSRKACASRASVT